MPPPQFPNPFRSARLTYHAIRPTEDLPVFSAINSDISGYQNSNFTCAKLPGPADALKFLTSTADDSLLAAIIWLPTYDAQGTEAPPVDAIIDPVRGTAIGEIHLSSLPSHARQHRHTEIGVDILPAYQGKGYGSEAILWATAYAFRSLGMHRVQIRAFGWNEGAVRLYEKLGFVRESVEREKFWFEGKWWDGFGFAILEGEWWEWERAKKEIEEEVKQGNAGGVMTVA